MVVKRYRKGNMTCYVQPFDRYPSRKDRDFVEQMDRQHQKLTRLCLKQTDFEEDCEKHLGQLPPYIQKHFYPHFKEYESRRNAIKHLKEHGTLQGYQIEDCKHLHVVKYKVVDVDIEEENRCTDDTIVHDIRPLTPVIYNAATRNDVKPTDERDSTDDNVKPTDESDSKDDDVKPTNESECTEDNVKPTDESESKDDDVKPTDESESINDNCVHDDTRTEQTTDINLDVLRMLCNHVF